MTDLNIDAYLSKEIYNDLRIDDKFGEGGRFVVKDVRDDSGFSGSGYYGAVIHDTVTGQATLVSRGTEPDSFYDLLTDVNIGLGGIADTQFDAAQNFYDAYKAKSNLSGYVEVTHATGHSLGGYISKGLGIVNDFFVSTFGSPGGQAMLDDLEFRNYGANIENYDFTKVINVIFENDHIANFGDRFDDATSIILNPSANKASTNDETIRSEVLGTLDQEGVSGEVNITITHPVLGLLFSGTKLALETAVFHPVQSYIKGVGDSAYVEKVIQTIKSEVLTVTYEGTHALETLELNPAEVQINAHDARVADFEANGTIISDVTDTTQQYGVTYNTRTQVIEKNGEIIKITELELPSGGAFPFNGVRYQRFESEYNENGQEYIAKEETTFIDAAGLEQTTTEFRDSEDGNWQVSQDTKLADGTIVSGDTYIVPSDGLLAAFDIVGGSVGSFLGAQLADGDKYQDLVYSTLLKTIGQHFGTFAAYVGAGNNFLNAVDAAMGGSIEGTEFENVDFSNSFFSNLNLKASSLLGSIIVDEVGDVLGIEGVAGEVFDVVGNTLSAAFVGQTIDFVLGDLQGTFLEGLADGQFFEQNIPVEITLPDGSTTIEFRSVDIQGLVVNALATYAGSRLAGEIISPESEQAGLFGSIGTALGSAIGGAQIGAQTLLNAFGIVAGGPVGIVIGSFVGTVVGTAFGNLFGSEDDEPQAWANIIYRKDEGEYKVGSSWGADGGDSSVASSMAQQVIQGINQIIDVSHGKLRSGASAPRIQIGFEGNEFQVAVGGGGVKSFGTTADAINYAAFKIMKDFDLVGGHAVVMRAWHNSDATNIYEWLEDIQTAEAFQNYLADPTAILALMMNEPESGLAQSWATILNRAAELELHLPHEKDLDGGWGEILLAQGADSSFIPDIQGDSIILTNPVTGEETIMQHVIGPGYEMVRIEGTDGNDIIEVIVDGPSITYVNGGEGDDVIDGSDQADVLVGGSGDDIINGHEGNDWLHGGAGDDTVSGGAGEDLVVGGEQNDVLNGGTENDHIYGNGGDDVILGNEGQDFIFGGTGNDTLDAGLGQADEIYGGAGDDTIHAGEYLHKLYGGAGDDTFIIGQEDNRNSIYISRGDGHDIIQGKSSNVTYLKFSSDISAEELLFKHIADDLVIFVLGEDQSVTIQNYYGPEKPYIYLETYGGSLNAVLWNNASINGAINNLVKNHENIPVPTGQYNFLSDSDIKLGESGAGSFDVWRPGLDINGANFLGDGNSSFQVGTNQNISTAMSVLQGGTIHGSASWSPRIIYGGAGNDVISDKNDGGFGALYGDSGDDTITGRGGHDTLVGGLGDDALNGGSGRDKLFGGHGNDYIDGGTGEDRIDGGAGNDEIHAGSGDDEIKAGEGDDIVYSDEGNDLVKGGEGNDIINGDEGDDTLYGGLGDDIINGDEGVDTIFGDEGNDIIDGGTGDDWISAGEGNDIITSGAGNDSVNAGEGDDNFIHIYSDNLGFENEYYGGAGNDKLSIYISAADYALSRVQADIIQLKTNVIVNANLTSAVVMYAFLGLALKDIENVDLYIDGLLENIDINTEEGSEIEDTIVASSSNDLIMGYAGDDFIQGLDGHDDLRGGNGRDILEAGLGQDVVYGDNGDDYITGEAGEDRLFGGDDNDDVRGGSGNDYVEGNDGDDTVSGDAGDDVVKGGYGDDILKGGSGDDIIDGGHGIDTISYEEATDRTFIDLITGEATDDGQGGTDIFTNIENVVGSNFRDTIITNHLDNTVHSGAHVDWIFLSEGTNIVYAGTGNDRINSTDSISGVNSIFGEGGNDTVIAGMQGTNVIDGGNGNDTLSYSYMHSTSVSVDMLKGTVDKNNDGLADDNFTSIEKILGSIEADVVLGSLGNDNIQSGNGDDVVKGGAGADTLTGGNQNDIIYGGAGNDYIRGGNHNDVLFGQDGFDRLNGEAGADKFVFEKATAFNDVDWIQDFNITDGDQIDLSDMLDQYDPAIDDISDFVQITDNGTDSFIAVDIDGGADNFVQIVIIKNVIELTDVSALEATGTLISHSTSPVSDNSGPEAHVDYFVDSENQTITGNVLIDNGNGADSDADNDLLEVVGETITTNNGGNVTILQNGYFTYTPVAGFSGQDSFDYTVYDGNGGSDIGTVNLTLEIVNNAPVAVDDSFSGVEDQSIIGNVLTENGIDSDTDGDILTVIAETVTSLQGGTVTILENGGFTYVPVQDFEGADNFVYTVIDGNGGSGVGTVTLIVSSQNDDPVAVDDNINVNEDASFDIDVLGNDTDVDGNALSITAVSGATNGLIAINPDDTVKYTPNANFYGPDSFTYTVEDGQGGGHSATVNVTVDPVNDNPIGVNDSLSGTQNQNITGNVLVDNGNGVDSDSDGDVLTVVAEIITSAQGGSVSILSNGDFTYTPAASFMGVDSFNYTLSDGNGGSAIGTVNLTVEAGLNIIEGTEAAETLNGTTDADQINGLGGHDTIYGDAGDDIIDGGVGNDKIYGGAGSNTLYGGSGNDTFYLEVGTSNTIDGGGGSLDTISYISEVSSISVNFNQGTVDKSGGVQDNFVAVEKIIGTLFNDTMIGANGNDRLDGYSGDDIIDGGAGNDLLYGKVGNDYLYGGDGNDKLYGGNTNDLLSGQDGYDRLYGQSGADTFVFESASAFNDIDQVEDFDLSEGDKIDLSDLLAQYDPLTENITDFVQITDDGTDSFIAVDIDGGADNFVQMAKLKNVIGLNDELALEADGTLIANIVGEQSVNNIPVATEDNFTGIEGQNIAGNVLVDNGNGVDSDPDGDVLTVVEEIITSAQGGSVSILSNGDFTYTPATNFSGADSFNYTLSDGNGGSAIGTVNLTVEVGLNIIEGTESAETLNGTTDADQINGLGGNDTIYGDDGDDVVYGGLGNDSIYGGLGNNTLYGEGGSDKFRLSTGSSNTIEGSAGSDTIYYITESSSIMLTYTGIGTGTIDNNGDGAVDDSFIGIEKIFGSSASDIMMGNIGNDKLDGYSGDDIIDGGAGNDLLYGKVGNDYLYGGDGNDKLYGGNTNDLLSGQDGYDRLYGQSGADTFVFESASAFNDIDQVEDFDLSEGDKIDLSDLLAQYDSLTENITDFVQITDDGTDSFIAVDIDGGADNFVQMAKLKNVIGLNDELALETNGTLIAS